LLEKRDVVRLSLLKEKSLEVGAQTNSTCLKEDPTIQTIEEALFEEITKTEIQEEIKEVKVQEDLTEIEQDV